MAKKINPIQRMEDVERIRRRLFSNPRDLLLFNLITQAGLKLRDVLNFKVKDLAGLSEGDPIPVSDTPSDLEAKPIMTRRIKESYNMLIEENRFHPEDYLIRSKKGKAPLEPPSVSRLVSQWFRQEKLKGLTGVKSLRKTWERHFRPNTESVGLETKSSGESIYGNFVTRKISDQIHTKLLDLILTGRLAPGQRLISLHIAEEMNVSPMPVRDALNRLAANGIVNLESNRSYYVNSLSQKDLIEITDMRMILEPIAAVKASKMASDREIEGIIKIADKFQKAVDHEARDTYIKINRDFHFKIYNCSRNQKMINFIDQLWNMLSPYQYLLSAKSCSHNFTEGGYKNHQEIVSALRKGDKESLESWVRKDIRFAFNGIMAEFFK
jgi:DNA-binding GntR family transcriptional regulator